MTRQHELLIDGSLYGITVSDEREALLTAKAVGRAFVAVGDEMFSGIGVEYAVESFEAVDEEYLERVLRRHLGLPWHIIESDRLLIRELTPEDYKSVSKEEGAFSNEEQYLAYLNSQYRFYEYGLWGIERREDGSLVGTAGVWNYEPKRTGNNRVKIREPQNVWKLDKKNLENEIAEEDFVLQLELGYRTFAPYRRNGYAEEACKLILSYVGEWYGEEYEIFAVTKASNTASESLLKKLKFMKIQ
ncbi:GNAT family N-acetyltransferase [Brotaphodocola sp.]|uniref:GNAT family N-acetyltransferase n=1 Tax=Brotaphodocola sp. TaxID=3073577 RepID=UPI003D7E29A9